VQGSGTVRGFAFAHTVNVNLQLDLILRLVYGKRRKGTGV
jgi:hypothetical protein